MFANLSSETLTRRMHLKPLLEQMCRQNYNWGFPACLVGWKDSSDKLRFPEELQDFCKKIEITAIDIPEWLDTRRERLQLENGQWQLEQCSIKETIRWEL